MANKINAVTWCKMAAILLGILVAPICQAQNYQCLRSGIIHYFTNENGYLRCITIDSVRQWGETTVYYPFHTPRGSYDITGSAVLALDAKGGSWLGKKVQQLNDGTFIFDNYWSSNNYVKIKTQAGTGDSWVFYKDSGSVYYKATLVSKSTMTIFSVPDSIETIMINAYNSEGAMHSDSLDGFKIILSKNNGFVQVFDLYTFPYHKPNDSYTAGQDFFLDRSSCSYYDVNFAKGFNPAKSTTLFKLVNFINPNDQQLHNWNVGDIIENYHNFSVHPDTSISDDGESYYDNILETVTNKVVSGHAVYYTFSGDKYVCNYYTDPGNIIANARRYAFYDTVYSIADASFLPESNVYTNYIYYFPDDASDCSHSPEYVKILAGYYVVHPTDPTIYKLGIGLTYFQYVDEDDMVWEFDGLTYTKFKGITCGTLIVNNPIVESSTLDVYPNPASTEINVTAEDKIYTLAITNLSEQTVYTKEYKAKHRHVKVDVTDLSPGVYFVTVNEADIKKFVKE